MFVVHLLVLIKNQINVFVEKWLLLLLLALASVCLSRSRMACFTPSLVKLLCGAGNTAKIDTHASDMKYNTRNEERLISLVMICADLSGRAV